MSLTIKDVARRAGVAVSTVSLVVNRKGKVSAATQEKVQRAIDELNYHPRRSARGLVTQRSGNIGFILTNDHFSNAEPFYTKVFLGTEFEARKHDYYILLTTTERKFTQDTVPRFLLERNVDGVIMAGTVPTKMIEHVKDQGLPLVLVDYYPKRGNFSCVLIDNVGGARKATEHLIHKGHRQIAFIAGDMEHPSLRDRFMGYRSAHEKANLSVDEDLICCDEPYTGVEDGYDAAGQLLARGARFTAVFAANDALAVGALRRFREHDIRIPADVAMIGFDDVEAATNARPALSTIIVPKEEMGAIALRRVVDMINHRNDAVTRTVVPVKLIVRGSC